MKATSSVISLEHSWKVVTLLYFILFAIARSGVPSTMPCDTLILPKESDCPLEPRHFQWTIVQHTYLARGLTVIMKAVPLGRGLSIAHRIG